MNTIEDNRDNYLKTDKQYKLLIVEDAESIRIALRDYFMPFFDVEAVSSAEHAQDLIQASLESNTPYDLLITDIHLEGKTGIDLILYTHENSPYTKSALITSYDINNYIDYIKEHAIDQVISKHSQLSLHQLHVMAYKLVTQDIFGVQKYFRGIKVYYPTEVTDHNRLENRELYSVTIKSSDERIYWTDHISELLSSHGHIAAPTCKLILDEVTTNALVRAPQNDDGTHKYQVRIDEADILIPDDSIILDPEDYFTLQYGVYDDWTILVCTDPQGSLRKKEVLYRLARHIRSNPSTGLPDGLTDSHGRGIFLLREHLTHLIFNIQKNKKTEVLCLYNKNHDMPYKDISIYDLNWEEDL